VIARIEGSQALPDGIATSQPLSNAAAGVAAIWLFAVSIGGASVDCLASGTGLERRSRGRVARFSGQLPGDLTDVLWEEPKSLADAGEVLNSRSIRRTVKFQWAGGTYVLKHYIEPTFAYALKHS
jgi:hypothetical protein